MALTSPKAREWGQGLLIAITGSILAVLATRSWLRTQDLEGGDGSVAAHFALSKCDGFPLRRRCLQRYRIY